MPRRKSSKLAVFVSSSVYGREPLLEQIVTALDGFGFQAWNSHVGSMPHGFQNTYEGCLDAVAECDIFLGLINPRYGSGTDGAGGKSITHLELEKAIASMKPRFTLAHEQVVHARRLLMDLSFPAGMDRSMLSLRKGASVIDDLRLVDMYDEATQEHLPIPQRDSNWVQKYKTDAEVLRYIETQFGRYKDMQRLIDDWQRRKGLKP
ncbi:MAG: hypothetical protein C0465_25790 [Ralstonia sp.]|uniref:DUF4062 domain-containing protein n=1 Tax=Ralstonia sp. TaxID=54061 RepID=UPI0025798123|nr:DUF4062 domain-containing protein [Ralstonia sp.]MBA4233989.1 hypothetical protein [Ralstonia sp.]